MCGIFVTSINTSDEDILKVCEKHLRFRGEDASSGIINYGKWKLLHYRLSIIGIDVPDASQPLITEHGALVYNGEILNYRTLKEKYKLTCGESDTAILN